MIVAMSAAPAAVARSATVSSLTSAPAAVSLSRSLLQPPHVLKGGQPVARGRDHRSKASFSTMTARAAELDRIHSACSAEEVS